MRTIAFALSAATFLWLLWYGWTSLFPEIGFVFVVPWTAFVLSLLALNVRAFREVAGAGRAAVSLRPPVPAPARAHPRARRGARRA